MANKKAIIEGGSSGMGKATAQRFAREGWRVAVAFVDLQQAVEMKDAFWIRSGSETTTSSMTICR